MHLHRRFYESQIEGGEYCGSRVDLGVREHREELVLERPKEMSMTAKSGGDRLEDLTHLIVF